MKRQKNSGEGGLTEHFGQQSTRQGEAVDLSAVRVLNLSPAVGVYDLDAGHCEVSHPSAARRVEHMQAFGRRS